MGIGGREASAGRRVGSGPLAAAGTGRVRGEGAAGAGRGLPGGCEPSPLPGQPRMAPVPAGRAAEPLGSLGFRNIAESRLLYRRSFFVLFFLITWQGPRYEPLLGFAFQKTGIAEVLNVGKGRRFARSQDSNSLCGKRPSPSSRGVIFWPLITTRGTKLQAPTDKTGRWLYNAGRRRPDLKLPGFMLGLAKSS